MAKSRETEILQLLEKVYTAAKPGLSYDSPFQLLIAVILSAQCTDTVVNKVTKRLFSELKTASDFTKIEQEELEERIKECGLYRNKAANILAACVMLLQKFNGKVPETREELMQLPGVGRKSANVVLSQAYKKPAMAVDTHVFRVSRRLGLAEGKTPDTVEKELTELIPETKWSEAHLWLILHGRSFCKARRPKCGNCPLRQVCPSSGAAEKDG